MKSKTVGQGYAIRSSFARMKSMRLHWLSLLLVLLVSTPALPDTAAAAAQTPSRQDRELILSAVNIGMTETQRHQFTEKIAEFLDNYRFSMLKIARGHNATDLDRKMKKKHRSLFIDLDAQMTSMLTAEQFQRYGAYRQQLETRLTEPADTDAVDILNWEIAPANHH